MDAAAAELIRQRYQTGDAVAVLTAVIEAAGGGSLDEALAVLEEAVTGKRLAWLQGHGSSLTRTGNPVADGYRAFYEGYLGLSLPRDGEIVSAGPARLVSRWRNACPTLEACRALGLDTREICRKAYHRPVEAFLRAIDPRLRFGRDYATLRPHGAFCEETIWLDEGETPS